MGFACPTTCSATRFGLGWTVGLLWTALCWAEPQTRPLPNVLILYADDLGYGDLGCYRQQAGGLATPHIDKLSQQGMRFTDAHASSAVCSPSRYTLLTGRYHWRTRLQSGIVGLWGSPVIAEDRLTIGQLARKSGYTTACIGKWHLGWDWPIPPQHRAFMEASQPTTIGLQAWHQEAWRAVFANPLGSGPTSRGFDTYFGTDVPNWPPYCFIQQDRTLGIPNQWLDAAQLQRNLASKQGPAVAGWKLESILPTLTDRCLRFLESQQASTQPFLLYFSLTSPHTPLAVNAPWKGSSGLGPYGDLVMETDAAVGQVLEALETHGLAENTWVIFTSDNGCAPYVDVKTMEARGHMPSGPLRGYKSDAWEGGHRIPLLMRWPGVIEPGRVSDALVHQADLMATLAAMTATPLLEDEAVDSFSLLELIQGGTQAARDHAISCSIRGVPAIRMGHWKLILEGGSGGWSSSDTQQGVQLYDLNADLGETRNLAEAFPDRVAQIRSAWENWIDRGRTRPGLDQANDVSVKRWSLQAEKAGPN